MIRVRKPSTPPAVLRSRGAKARRAHCAAYARRPKRYSAGEASFEFDAGLYAHPTVKQALLEAQHGKCAFCESKITHIAYGDVEHFRPKAGWRQTEHQPLQRPGYYWLAYEWTNLFVACELCNQRFKRNLFPLKVPGKRARTHSARLEDEAPLLIDPAADSPEDFISFREEVLYPLRGTERAVSTISSLGLNRAALAESRLDHLKMVKALRFIASRRVPEAAEAREQLRRFQLDSAPYAAMTRALLR